MDREKEMDKKLLGREWRGGGGGRFTFWVLITLGQQKGLVWLVVGKVVDKLWLLMQAPPTDPLYDASHPGESTKYEMKAAGFNFLPASVITFSQ